MLASKMLLIFSAIDNNTNYTCLKRSVKHKLNWYDEISGGCIIEAATLDILWIYNAVLSMRTNVDDCN